VKMLNRIKRYTPAVNAVNTDKIKIIFFIHSVYFTAEAQRET